MSILSRLVDRIDALMHPLPEPEYPSISEVFRPVEDDPFDPYTHETALERQERRLREREAMARANDALRAAFREREREAFRLATFERMAEAGTVQLHNTPDFVIEWIDRFFDALHPVDAGTAEIAAEPMQPIDLPPFLTPVA